MEERTSKVRPGNHIPDHVDCRCIAARMLPETLNQELMNFFKPIRILKNGPATVVFWKDGTKTVVKRGGDTAPNDYEAFTAALAIRVFGNNSCLKKLILKKTVEQKPKVQKKSR